MLLEPITLYKNLHFAIHFSNVAQEAPHYHKETELTLVLKGTVTYKIHHQEFHLHAGDTIVVDTQDLHRITNSSEDVIMLTFYIDMEAFTDLYPNIDFMIFACEELSQDASQRQQKMQNKISFLTHHMAEMMFLYRNSEDTLMTEKLQEILYLMVNQFQGFFIENREFRSGSDDVNQTDLDRLYRIIHYLYRNYSQKITLQDIAEMEHLSIYYASHLIKKLSGLSFQNLLNYIRVENSERYLNEDKYTLTQISEECGFSSLAYYNKCFKLWHGITPAQYRKQPRPKVRHFHKPFLQSEAWLLLEPYLNAKLPESANTEHRFSTHHIFIPLQILYKEKMPVRKMLPLHLLVEDRSQMAQCMQLPMLPESVSIGNKSESFPITNTAEAVAYLLKEQKPTIRFCGKSPTLLTKDGFPTPFYSLFQSFRSIDGFICEHQQQYVLIKNTDFFTLLLFNTNESDLHVHLQFLQKKRPDFMVKKVLSHVPATLPKPLLFDLADGCTELLSGIQSEITVHHGEVVILSF